MNPISRGNLPQRESVQELIKKFDSVGGEKKVSKADKGKEKEERTTELAKKQLEQGIPQAAQHRPPAKSLSRKVTPLSHPAATSTNNVTQTRLSRGKAPRNETASSVNPGFSLKSASRPEDAPAIPLSASGRRQESTTSALKPKEAPSLPDERGRATERRDSQPRALGRHFTRNPVAGRRESSSNTTSSTSSLASSSDSVDDQSGSVSPSSPLTPRPTLKSRSRSPSSPRASKATIPAIEINRAYLAKLVTSNPKKAAIYDGKSKELVSSEQKFCTGLEILSAAFKERANQEKNPTIKANLESLAASYEEGVAASRMLQTLLAEIPAGTMTIFEALTTEKYRSYVDTMIKLQEAREDADTFGSDSSLTQLISAEEGKRNLPHLQGLSDYTIQAVQRVPRIGTFLNELHEILDKLLDAQAEPGVADIQKILSTLSENIGSVNFSANTAMDEIRERRLGKFLAQVNEDKDCYLIVRDGALQVLKINKGDKKKADLLRKEIEKGQQEALSWATQIRKRINDPDHGNTLSRELENLAFEKQFSPAFYKSELLFKELENS